MAWSARAFLDAVPAAKHKAGKPEPILFADTTGPQLAGPTSIMYFQFVGGGEWYSADAFTSRGARGGMTGRLSRGGPPGMGGAGPGLRGGRGDRDQSTDAPTVFDPQRAAFMQQLYSKMSSTDLAREETKLLGNALKDGREIYAVLLKDTANEFRQRLKREGFDCTLITTWKEFQPPAEENESLPPLAGGMMPRGGQGRRPGGMGGFGGPGGFGAPGMMGGLGGFGGGPTGQMEPRAAEPAATFEVLKVSKSAATQSTALND
jgi:hypothetical protein